MRPYPLPTFLLALVLLTGCGQKEKPDSDRSDRSNDVKLDDVTNARDTTRKYGVRSGIVLYKALSSDSTINETDTFYFDDYGAKEAMYAPDFRGHDGKSINLVTMYADGWMRQYDALAKKGEQFKRPMHSGPLNGSIPDHWNEPRKHWKMWEVEELEPRRILGKETKGYSFKDPGLTKVWLWEGIPLYMEGTDVVGITTRGEVVSLQTDIAVPAERFTVPEGIEMTDRK